MADRFPLILNTSTNQIQEIASGDQLDLTGNNLANAGIITATTFSGNLTGNVTGNINGNLTGTLQTAAQPNITSLGTLSSLNVSGNASIGGVLTYEDVTSVDSIGIITARAGVHCSTDGVGNGIKVGAGSDLIIQHNGTNSFIDNNTGDLYIQTTGSGDDILIESADDFTVKVNGSETAIQATGDGAVNLYFDNSKKLETTSSGAKITGTATATGSLIVGSGNDLQFTRNSGNTEIQNYSGTLLFSNASSNSNNVFIRGRSDENSIICIPDGAVELYFDNSKKLETTSTGITVTGDLTFSDSVANDIHLRGGKIYGDDGALPAFTIQNTSGNANHAKIIIGANNSDNGGIEFYGAGSSSSDLKMTIRGNTDTVEIPDNHKFVCGDGSDLQIFHNGTHSYIQESGAGALQIRGANLILDNADGSKRYIDCNDGGSVELYYDNSQKMLTSSTGINVNFRIAASGDENTYVNLGNPADQWQFYTGGVDRLFITGGPSDDGTVQIRGDNNKLQIGASQDLQLFHDGSHSRLYSATGMFNIQSDDFRVTDAANSLTAFKIDPDGATDLRYNGSVKLQTTSSGVTVIGDLFFDNPSNADADLKFVASDSKLKFNDNVKANFGSGNDLQVYHNGSHSYIDEVGTGNLYIRNGTKNSIWCQTDGQVKLYYNDSAKFETTSAGATVTGTLTATSFAGDGSALTGLGGGVPSGCILLWSGAANAIPTGYVLCDGNNSTPNLSGRFVVGYHASNGDYDVGDTGGAETVTLTEAQMPAHNHHSYIANDGSGPFGSVRASGNNNAQGAVATTTKGGGNAHENRPPYYSLCYIMKT